MNKFLQNVWFEKYRPQTLDDIVLDEDILNVLKEYKRKGDIGNILLVGQQGIGKTSVAKIIANDILDCQYLYINASDENGIDTIRNKVTNFVNIKSYDGKIKLVILDEMDGATNAGQQALRNLMESYLNNARFVLTANYGHKIIEPIKSRCQSFDLKYDKKSYVKRMLQILKSESVEFDPQIVLQTCLSYYPDFRGCINELQKSVIDGKLSINSTPLRGFVDELFTQFSSNIEDIRKYYLGKESHFNNDYEFLLNGIYDYICNKDLDQLKKMESILIIADALKSHAIVSNPEINFYATIIKLKKLLS